MKALNKKGQVNTIMGIGMIAISIMVAVVILVIGPLVLTEIQGNTDNLVGTPVVNESITWPGNNTYYSLAQSDIVSGSVVLWNQTDLMTENTDFELNGSSIKFTNKTGHAGWNTSVEFNVTYNYHYGSAAYNTTIYGMTGSTTMASFVPTVALVAIAAIVLGIIFVMFGRRKY